MGLIAAILSFFFSGLGQVYNRQWNKATVFIDVELLRWYYFFNDIIHLHSPRSPLHVIGTILWIVSIFDALLYSGRRR
jgi:hypothetical protein